MRSGGEEGEVACPSRRNDLRVSLEKTRASVFKASSFSHSLSSWPSHRPHRFEPLKSVTKPLERLFLRHTLRIQVATLFHIHAGRWTLEGAETTLAKRGLLATIRTETLFTPLSHPESVHSLSPMFGLANDRVAVSWGTPQRSRVSRESNRCKSPRVFRGAPLGKPVFQSRRTMKDASARLQVRPTCRGRAPRRAPAPPGRSPCV